MPSQQCPFQHLYDRLKPISSRTQASVVEAMEAWYDLLAHEHPRRATHWAKRKESNRQEIAQSGTYRHTFEELKLGAKMAWRHSIRCTGRYFWHTLDVIDTREAESEEAIFEACIHHLRHATNRGNIRSTVTIFAPETLGNPGPRIWNPQLISYAGYRQPDGTVTGDPLRADLTRRIQELGWKGPGGRFDILPLVIQLPGKAPRLFELPQDAILEVPLSHPEWDWFASLGLRWYAVPVISNMALEIGGIRYAAAPFNGWYMGTEIGSRDLGDTDRYNSLPEIAARLGWKTNSPQSLWRDRALVELNQAVLHSFRSQGVKIIDHHTAGELHLKFEKDERDHSRPVTGLWSWLIPPLSGSSSPLWSRSYDETEYAPNFLHQKAPWELEEFQK